jgi:hypothetical protein
MFYDRNRSRTSVVCLPAFEVSLLLFDILVIENLSCQQYLQMHTAAAILFGDTTGAKDEDEDKIATGISGYAWKQQ